MSRALKWFGLAVGGVVLLALLFLAALYLIGGSRLNRVYDIKPEPVAVPSNAAAIERGRHWVSVQCAGCHGENLAGTPFFQDPVLAKIPASNLTSGKGGIGGSYEVDDWVRALRHGVGRNGKSLLIMPSAGYYWFSDEDLGAVIAYLRQVPAVDNDPGSLSISPLASVLFAAGAFGNALVAEVIDHSSARPSAPSIGVTVEYGEYLAKTGGCADCHGAALTGGQPAQPGSPPAPDLSPAGSMRGWSEADYIRVSRTRESPWMPYRDLGLMTDDELNAMWLYLRSLPTRSAK